MHLLLHTEARVKVLRAVGHSADIQWLKAINTDTYTLVVRKFHPAYICLVARLLRTNIGEELLIGRLLIEAQECRFAPIRIVLPRATTIELEILVVGGENHTHTEAGQFGNILAITLPLHLDLQRAIGTEGVDGGVVRWGINEVVVATHDNSIFVLLNLCAQGLTAVGAPYIGGALKTLAPVVVGGCTPEPRLRHLRHKISATRHEALQATIRDVEEHACIASKGCQPVLALLNLDFTLRKSLLEAVGLKHKLLLGSDMSLVEHAVEVYGILGVASHHGECPFGKRVIGGVVDSDIYALARRATR